MNRKNLFFTPVCILAILFMGYYFKKKKRRANFIYENRITVTGNARNMGSHAVIVTPSQSIYFVDQLGKWDPEWLNHDVKVTGDLLHNGREEDALKNSVAVHDSIHVIKAAVVLLLGSPVADNY